MFVYAFVCQLHNLIADVFACVNLRILGFVFNLWNKIVVIVGRETKLKWAVLEVVLEVDFIRIFM